MTAPLNHENTGNHPERITRIKPFINQYEWKEISLPTECGKIALTVLFSPSIREKNKISEHSKTQRREWK